MAGGTTLPRRALGRRMRELRAAAQKSQLAAGLAIDVSKQGIGRLEEGRPVRISRVQFRELLDFYTADEDAKVEVLGLLQEIKAARGDDSKFWWRAFADIINPNFKSLHEPRVRGLADDKLSAHSGARPSSDAGLSPMDR